MGQVPSTMDNSSCKKCKTVAPNAMKPAPTVFDEKDEHSTKCYWYSGPSKLGTVGLKMLKDGEPTQLIEKDKALPQNIGEITKPILYMRKTNAPGMYFCCKCFHETNPKTMLAVMKYMGENPGDTGDQYQCLWFEKDNFYRIIYEK